MVIDTHRPVDEAQIRQRVHDFAKAFRAKDIDGVMSVYAPDIVSFDLVPPLSYVGAEVYRQPWEATFEAYQDPIDYEVHDLHITTNHDVAFSYSLNRMRGTLKDGQQTDFWLRWTACYRKIDGNWLIVHEHVSVPVDLESGKGSLDLKP